MYYNPFEISNDFMTFFNMFTKTGLFDHQVKIVTDDNNYNIGKLIVIMKQQDTFS